MKDSQNPSNTSEGDMMSWQHNLEHDFATYEAKHQNRSQRLLTSDERWDVIPEGDFVETVVPMSHYLSTFTHYLNTLIPAVEGQIKNLRRV
jgi:hypothetical protein